MARELILMPKAKYELLTKEDISKKSSDNKPILFGRDVQSSHETTFDPQIDDMFENTLTYAIPKNGYRKAMGLWNHLKDRKGPILNWNDNGEIVVHGRLVPGSNIVDLLKYTVSPLSKTEPLGYGLFYDVLRELHTPTGFMVDHQIGRGYVKGKTDKGPPGRKQFRWIPY